LLGLSREAFEILTAVFLVVLWSCVGRWLDGALMLASNRARTETVKWKRVFAALALLAVIILDSLGWYASYRAYGFQNLPRDLPEHLFILGLWPFFLGFILARIAFRRSATASTG
jgi:hypothetical protein